MTQQLKCTNTEKQKKMAQKEEWKIIGGKKRHPADEH
jgi:hypothetical protein